MVAEVEALVQDHLLVVLDVQDQIQVLAQLLLLEVEVLLQAVQIFHLMDLHQFNEKV